MSFSLQGLASGLDTAEIIKGLMDVERVPYTNLETKKSQLQNQQAVFRQLNTKLNALQLAASEMRYESAYNKNSSSVSTSGILSATVGDSATKGSYEILVDRLAKNQVVGIENISSSGSELINETFEINGEPINIADLSTEANPIENNKEALEALVAKINSNSTLYEGKASLIDTDGSGNYTLSVSALSADKTITLTSADGSMVGVEMQAAQTSKLTINGIVVERPNNEVKDAVAGVTLNLTSTGSTTLNITKDSAAVIASAEKFVKAYNDLIESINLNLAKPTEEGITNPLQSDSVLKSLKDTLYSLFNEVIPASVINDGSGIPGVMEQIGLSIDKNITTSSQRTGKITFDKDAFTTAMNENSDKVMNMFIDRTDAIWNAMNNSFAGTTRGIIASKISGYDSQIKMVDERLEVMDRTLLLKEERLNKQFNSMEVMLSSLYNEQNWLASQFSSLMSSGS